MPSAVAPRASEPSAELTLSELSERTQVSSRTIRFYQSKGILPRPKIKGRVAYYADAHVERLQLIASLQDRGLRIEAIRALLSRVDKGEVDVAEWLGLEAQLVRPWQDDRPVILTPEELQARFGALRPGLLSELVDAKLVVRQGGSLLVESAALLDLAARLVGVGVELETGLAAANVLRKHLHRAAKELTELFLSYAERVDRLDYALALEALRPLAQEAVHLIFAQQMQKQLRALVESGRSAKVGGRSRAQPPSA